MHRSRTGTVVAGTVASLGVGLLALAPAAPALAATSATTSTTVAPTAADAARAHQDLSTYCTYAAASTGIRSEHPRWYASLCQGAGTQAEAAALRACYLAVAAAHPVSSDCLADVRAGAVWARLDDVESGATAAATSLRPHVVRVVHHLHRT